MLRQILFTSIFLMTAGIIFAQDRKKDEIAINRQVDAMINSWNNHNYNDLESYTTANTDWVNGPGMWWKGRKESQYGHQAYHNTIFKESVLTKTSVSIRFISKDVAIAHIFWHFSAFTDPAGKTLGPDDCVATIVYVNNKEKWLMEAGQNSTIVQEVVRFDPVKQMPKDSVQ